MDHLQVGLILLITFLGSLIHGLTGFGFSLVVMGVFTMFLSVRESTLLALALNTALSFHIVYKYRDRLIFKNISLILAGGLFGSFMGYFVLTYFGESHWIKMSLGFIMIFMVFMMNLTKKQEVWSNVLQRKWVVFLSGAAGGLIGGVFAIGGPFFVIYFLTKFSDKREYNVNMQVVFLAINIYTIVINGFAKGLDHQFYFYVFAGLPLVFIGVYLGLHLFEKFNRKMISRFVYGLIIVSGVNLLFFS